MNFLCTKPRQSKTRAKIITPRLPWFLPYLVCVCFLQKLIFALVVVCRGLVSYILDSYKVSLKKSKGTDTLN